MTLHFTTSIFRRSLSAVALLFALFGAHGSAFALTTEHATICKPYGNSNTPGLYSYVNGAYNYSGAAMGVVCPIIRTVEAGTGGYSVWVDGTAASGTAYCSIYSYSYTNTYLGSVNFTATGAFDQKVTLPQSMVPMYSSQALYCYLPNSGGLFDVEPIQ